MPQKSRLITVTGPYTTQLPAINYTAYRQGPIRSSETWILPSTCLPFRRVTDQTWMGGMTSSHFDQFNYDYRTFRTLDYDPNFLYPQPLPNSLPIQRNPQQGYNPWRGGSRLVTGAGEDGGSGGPAPPTNEERLQQAKEKGERNQQCIEELTWELAEAQKERDQYVELFQLPVKGKRLDRERAPQLPDKPQPLHERPDRYSIPCPPPKWAPPNPYP